MVNKRFMEPSLSTLSAPAVAGLQGELAIHLSEATSLLDASQRFASFLYESFPHSVPLVRVYGTVAAQQLPPEERAFIRELVGIELDARVLPATRILTLFGTRGVEIAWNDRTRSVGHRAIPLIDSAFIQAIPMVSSMLRELRIDPGGAVASVETKMLLGGHNGLFYVDDARTAADELGRRIIPAEGFVRQRSIRTVFGMGGSYMSGEAVVAILFCREKVSRDSAERFGKLIRQFKISTTKLVGFGRFFT